MVRLLVLAALVVACTAAPTATNDDFTPELADYYRAVSEKVDSLRREPNYGWNKIVSPKCDLSKAQQPTAPTPLPSPDGLKLVHVAVGRGTQNYTCASDTATDKPVAFGAVANLYDVSCVAVNQPELLQKLPGLALRYSKDSDIYSRLNLALSARHYFSNATTPVFDFNTSPKIALGKVSAARKTSSPAPTEAVKGIAKQMEGAVPWLLLTITPQTTGNIKSVYRLNTAGGSPPATCQGLASTFTVEYAAEYWFYASS